MTQHSSPNQNPKPGKLVKCGENPKSDIKGKGSSSHAVLQFSKPSRKTLLRIRYYEMKVQAEDFWERALSTFDRVTFHKFMNLHKGSKQEQICEQFDASTNTEMTDLGLSQRKRSRCRKKRSLALEADDEESETEPLKQREQVERESSTKHRKRKPKSFRTRARNPEEVASNASSRNLTSGDSKLNNDKGGTGSLENLPEKNDEEKKTERAAPGQEDPAAPRNDASCQTEIVETPNPNVDITNGVNGNNIGAVEMNPFNNPWKSTPDNKGDKKSFLDILVGLANRKRTKIPESQNVRMGVKLPTEDGGRRRRRKVEEDNFTDTTGHSAASEFMERENSRLNFSRFNEYQGLTRATDNTDTFGSLRNAADMSAIHDTIERLRFRTSPTERPYRPYSFDTTTSNLTSPAVVENISTVDRPLVQNPLSHIPPPDIPLHFEALRSGAKANDDEVFDTTASSNRFSFGVENPPVEEHEKVCSTDNERIYVPQTKFTSKFYSLLKV